MLKEKDGFATLLAETAFAEGQFIPENIQQIDATIYFMIEQLEQAENPKEKSIYIELLKSVVWSISALHNKYLASPDPDPTGKIISTIVQAAITDQALTEGVVEFNEDYFSNRPIIQERISTETWDQIGQAVLQNLAVGDKNSALLLESFHHNIHHLSQKMQAPIIDKLALFQANETQAALLSNGNNISHAIVNCQIQGVLLNLLSKATI